MNSYALKPNLFFPKSTSIDADRLTASSPAVYLIPDENGLTVSASPRPRELTILSRENRPIPVLYAGQPQSLRPGFENRLIVPPLTEIRFEHPEDLFVREEVFEVPEAPTPPALEPGEERLVNRASPLHLEFAATTIGTHPPFGRILYPTLSHGLSEILAFVPDNHFRGQFRLHPNIDLILTPLFRAQSKVVLEAIDLRSQSPSRLRTDAVVFKPSPFVSVTLPAGVAFRFQGRQEMFFRAEYRFYADSEKKSFTDMDVIWLGVGLAWPAVRVPTLRVSDDFVRAHFQNLQAPDSSPS